MKITATLVFFPDGQNVLAVGFVEGLTPAPLLLCSVGPTVMEAFQGMFAQAKIMSDAIAAARRAPLMPIYVN